jgi:hypothetical protein
MGDQFYEWFASASNALSEIEAFGPENSKIASQKAQVNLFSRDYPRNQFLQWFIYFCFSRIRHHSGAPV